MNFDDDKAWEERLDRALKDLPELSAPIGLVEKTISVLERKQKTAWRHQPWPMWPLLLRASSLGVMLTFVGALAKRFGAMKWEFLRERCWGNRWSNGLPVNFQAWVWLFANAGPCHRHRGATDEWLGGSAFAFLAATMAYAACIGLGTGGGAHDLITPLEKSFYDKDQNNIGCKY